MALWKLFRGNRADLDAVAKHDGYVYFCDDGALFFDFTDVNGNLQRKQINAKDAETLTGYDIATILNSSDVEIPTSKAVLDALSNKIDKIDGKGLSTNDYTTEEKNKLSGIATGAEVNVQSNWSETNSASDAYIINKPAITNGTGENSIVIIEGEASGDYSVAGGTVDSDVIKDLTGSLITPTLTAPEASGDMSLAFGANVKATSIGAIALGYDATAGVKGYYYHDITFNDDGTAKIYLAKTQTLDAISTSSSAFKADLEAHLLTETDITVADLGWTAGDYISIVNDHKFPFCAQITNVAVESRTFTKSIIISTLTATVDCIVVTVDSLPFTAVDEPTIKLPDDKTIFAIERKWDSTYNKYNVTLRNGAIELGWGALAIGSSNQALGSFSSATGYNNTAIGDFGSAEGRGTLAGYGAHSEGYRTEAKGTYSHAEGHTSIASGEAAHSEGKDTEASGLGAHAQNVGTIASGDAATSMGAFTKATANNAISMGHTTTASGNAALAGGKMTVAEGHASLAFGFANSEGGIEASGKGSIAMGDGLGKIEATGEGSVAIGLAQADKTLSASGYGSLALGVNTTASGSAATSTGSNTIASGGNSFATGHTTEAKGNAAFAEGRQSVAYGQTSHAEGYKTKAGTEDGSVSYESAHAEGYETTASGVGTHAEGSGTIAYGQTSHTEGYNTKTGGEDESNDLLAGTEATAGAYAHAEGNATIAQGVASHSEGQKTFAKGDHSHAEGKGTIASGDRSHAEGFLTEANGNDSHAEGSNTEANAYFSHAEGEGTIAVGAGSHVQGKYNIGDNYLNTINKYNFYGKYAHIVGNGISNSNRSNAHTLAWDGTAWFAGNVKIGGISDDDPEAKTLATTEYVDSKSSLPPATAVDSNKVLTINAEGQPEWKEPAVQEDKDTTYNIITDETNHKLIANDLENNIATGNYATALGSGAQAIGNYSFAVGAAVSSKPVKAEGLYSVAMGAGTYAKGGASTALGAYCTAEGSNSFAVGHTCYAKGNSAIALGKETRAIANYQVAVGAFNAEDSTAKFIVGAGTSNTVRSNAFTVGKDTNGAYITIDDAKFYKDTFVTPEKVDWLITSQLVDLDLIDIFQDENGNILTDGDNSLLYADVSKAISASDESVVEFLVAQNLVVPFMDNTGYYYIDNNQNILIV